MSLTLDRPQPTRLDAAQPRREPAGCYCNSPGWAVAHTRSQAELWAASNLRQRGYQTYLPLCAIRIRDRVIPTMTRIVSRPLFAGYLFVRHDPRDSWRPIYETPGIASVLKNGSQLQYARDADIRALQAGDDARATPPHPGASWAPGMPCRAATSPLRDLDAVVTQVHGTNATIGLIMLGQMRQLTVPVACLVARE